jgi:hypothetical protein
MRPSVSLNLQVLFTFSQFSYSEESAKDSKDGNAEAKKKVEKIGDDGGGDEMNTSKKVVLHGRYQKSMGNRDTCPC